MPNRNKPHHTPLKIKQPTLPLTPSANEHLDISPLATWHDADELRWTGRHWATWMGDNAGQSHLRPMCTKWASISTAGCLTLNPELLDLPKPLGEFVIVHELAHLLAPNHGKVFKSFMSACLPG